MHDVANDHNGKDRPGRIKGILGFLIKMPPQKIIIIRHKKRGFLMLCFLIN
jgi:hypothetical protein